MKWKKIAASIIVSLCVGLTAFGQVRANSPESRLFEQITSDANPESRLALISSFEKQYPNSKILSGVYLAAVEAYRQKGDREKINEYGEKALNLDNTNITAMMLLARNYAIESKNLDRAIELAQRAMERVVGLRGDPLPFGYTAAQWKDYLRTSEESASQILEYVKAMKARKESLERPTGSAAVGVPKGDAQPSSSASSRN